MKILVTGGNGFVGRNLVERLKEKHEVTVLDNLSTDHSQQEQGFEFIKGSVNDEALVSKLFNEHDFDLAYHLAAVVGIKNYIEKPFELIDVNILGTRTILNECMRRNTRLLFTSTSELFGKNPSVPWKEDDDRVTGNPKVERWVYGNSKAICEHMIYAAIKQKNFPATIVRYFNLYGPKQYPTNVVPRMACRALSGKNIAVYDDGTMTRSFCFIDDGIEATVLAATSEKAIGEAFNIGTSRPVQIKDLARKIIDASGEKTSIEFVDTKKLYGNSYEDLHDRLPNVEKIKNVLGWSASTSLEDGLKKTIDWYRSNREWWNEFKL